MPRLLGVDASSLQDGMPAVWNSFPELILRVEQVRVDRVSLGDVKVMLNKTYVFVDFYDFKNMLNVYKIIVNDVKCVV